MSAPPGAPRREEPLLVVRDLVQHFPGRRESLSDLTPEPVRAVRGVSFSLSEGETLGLVGESGCGKSTVALSVLRIHEPTSGSVRFDGEDMGSVNRHDLRMMRRRAQMVMQDPLSSLSPRKPVRASVQEPLDIHRIGSRRERQQRVDHLFERVGLSPELGVKLPHQLSGGQNQRVAIARALALNPRLVVLDEAISALDVSVQAQIINLLRELQRESGLAYLFISHDLAVVRQMCDRVAVMYLGKIVEENRATDLFDDPMHPYTRALMSAIPNPDPESEAGRKQIVLSGDVPSPSQVPVGCAFKQRCPIGSDRDVCGETEPSLNAAPVGGGRVACHFAGEPIRLDG